MTSDQLEEEQALIRMWERRCKEHPLLETMLRLHQIALARMDKELRGISDTRPLFEEDLDELHADRVAAIGCGRSVTDIRMARRLRDKRNEGHE